MNEAQAKWTESLFLRPDEKVLTAILPDRDDGFGGNAVSLLDGDLEVASLVVPNTVNEPLVTGLSLAEGDSIPRFERRPDSLIAVRELPAGGTVAEPANPEEIFARELYVVRDSPWVLQAGHFIPYGPDRRRNYELGRTEWIEEGQIGGRIRLGDSEIEIPRTGYYGPERSAYAPPTNDPFWNPF